MSSHILAAFINNIYSAKKETHMWFNRNFFRYGVYMTETTIYDWNQQFVRNQNLFVNLLLCETGVCSGPLSATRSITCVATSCFLHCSASAWHGWNQTCNLCMWDVIPGLLDSQTQLWEGLRRWVSESLVWGGQSEGEHYPVETLDHGVGRRGRPRVGRNAGHWEYH